MFALMSHLKRCIWLSLTACVLLAHLPSSAHAATSCTAPDGTLVGIEFIPDQCVSLTMDDNTSIHYIDTAVQCSGGQVVLYAPYGDTQGSPASIINLWKSQGYKIFRNREGTHVVAISPYYSWQIDGKNMSSYSAGQVYTDVFSQGFVLPGAAPNCQGSDFNWQCNEQGASSTVNLGTGRLSHDQELFALKSNQPLSLSISLFYRSIQFAPSAIGNGWSHTYEMSLQFPTGSYVTLWINGARRTYSLYNGVYYPPNGDFSTLVKNGDGTYTITEKDGLKRNFNASGTITSMVDRNTNTLTFNYTSGKLASVVDTNNRTATFGYDVNNKLSTVTDPKGNVYTLAYTSGNLTSVTNPDAGHWTYTYGANGLMATKTDPENNQVTYNTYDAGNRLTQVTDPESKTRGYAYPAVVTAGKIPDPYPVPVLPQKQFTLTEKDGGNWTSTYDTRTERVSKKVDPYGNAYSYTYDLQRNMLSRTEPGVSSTVTTTYTYDAKGNVLSQKEPLNRTTYYTYNSYSSVLTITGAPGNFANIYDANGNLRSATEPGITTSVTTTYTYDGKGNLTSITDPRNNTTQFGYDANNNRSTVTLATGAVTTLTDYDANGNVKTMIDANGKITRFTYDPRNRLATITDPLLSVTTFSYDKNGNLKTLTDANGKTTTNAYNYLGQITSTLNALNSGTTFSYGQAGCPSCTGVDQLTGITDAKNHATSWAYDKLGRLLTETDPLLSATTYSYGAITKPSSKTDANSATTYYGYDALQRLTRKTYPDSSATYTYDSRNNIRNASNQNIAYTFDYYDNNRLKSVTDSRGYTINYSYDNAGNRTQMVLQPGTGDQRTTTFSYDSRNRMQNTISSAGTFTFGYNLLDLRVALAYPNQISTSYGYDDAGRLLTITTNPVISSFTYSYDAEGNRLSKSSTVNESYGYDDVYRLLRTDLPEGTENFTYDAVGNRTAGPGPKDTGFTYNAANEMTHGRILGYTYDNNGNQTSRIVSGGTGTRTWAQTWDYENRLVKVEKIKGTERRTVTFTYDPFNRRISKQLSTVISGQTNTYTWNYVYDNDNIALEIYIDNNGSTTKTWYTQGSNIDEHLALERNGSYYYYHAEGLGSVVAITDSSRNTIQGYTYDSYGLPKPATGFINSYTFTGREWDPQIGLYYYRARYYDPMEGRFISKDPLGLRGGVNVFAYVGDDPINYEDPLGLVDPHSCQLNLSTGQMTCTYYGSTSHSSGGWVSGLGGPCQNNPNPGCTSQTNVGPIPTGRYTSTGRPSHRPTNTTRRNLSPDPLTNTYGRGNPEPFQTHYCPDPETCSRGCITQTDWNTMQNFNLLLDINPNTPITVTR